MSKETRCQTRMNVASRRRLTQMLSARRVLDSGTRYGSGTGWALADGAWAVGFGTERSRMSAIMLSRFGFSILVDATYRMHIGGLRTATALGLASDARVF